MLRSWNPIDLMRESFHSMSAYEGIQELKIHHILSFNQLINIANLKPKWARAAEINAL